MSWSLTSSGMMLCLVPPWIEPTVTTAGSLGSISRLTIVWRSTITSAARTIGSTVRCGQAPWPPLPRMMTLTEVELASSRARAVADGAGRLVGPAVQRQGEVGLGEPGIEPVVEHRAWHRRRPPRPAARP